MQTTEITEKAWQKQLEALAKTLGYTHIYHTFMSRWSDKGFPDLVLVHPGQKRVVYIECKRESGKLTDHQREWLAALESAGQEAYVLRPSDWDRAVEILQKRNGAGQ